MTKEDILDGCMYQVSTRKENYEAILKAMNEYAAQEVIKELESLLNDNSTQAYWPAIIKQRINKLKGNG